MTFTVFLLVVGDIDPTLGKPRLRFVGRSADLPSADRLILEAGCDQAGLVGVDHGLHTVAKVELLENARNVRLGRCLADDEALADLVIRQTAGEEVEYLSLARCQLTETGRRCGRRHGRLAGELLDHSARYRRGEERLAARDDPDGGRDLPGRRVLQHEAARAGAEGVVDVSVEPERRQDQDPRAELGAD